MLTVWGRRSSSNVQTVMWCIAELQLAVSRVDAGFKYGITDTAEYLAMNPNGKIPTLKDGSNEPLWESAAIIRYLANTYSGNNFWPEDPIDRAHVDMWAEWAKQNVAGEFTGPVFWQAVRVPEARRDKDGLFQAVKYFERQLEIADMRLGSTACLAGENFTVADIQFGHVLYRYFDIQIPRSSGLINVRRYFRDLQQRPAYREHVMVSYAELKDTM